MKNKLYPCPFCGEKWVEIAPIETAGMKGYRVYCMNIRCATDGPVAVTKSQARKYWNKRYMGEGKIWVTE